MLRFPGLESPGKRHRSWKTLQKSWNSKVVVLEILISGTIMEIGEAIKNPAYRIFQTEYSGCLDISAHA